jgi:hypothetical protein
MEQELLITPEHLSKERQTLEYRIKGEIYTSYTGVAGMLLHMNGKFTIGKLKLALLSYRFVLNQTTITYKSNNQAKTTILANLILRSLCR